MKSKANFVRPAPASGRYPGLSIGLHWLMLILLVAVYACMELRDFFPRGSDMRAWLKTLHYMLGLSVLVLACLRLAVALAGTVPAITPAVPMWQTRLAQAVQAGLYVLMIGLPLLGWLTVSAQGNAVDFLGMRLPLLVSQDKGLAESFKELHEAGATLGYVLVGLHAAAALFHHYVMRDNTLRRMLPGKP